MGQVIENWQELAEAVEAHRRRGDRIVTTNGVFDVLHVGHARYLRAARALGDMLVVGVNSDACARRLKGPSRPIVPQAERAELVASLASVDFVTIFDDPTPIQLLEVLRPHLHAKGGDYQTEQMPETAVVRRGGGDIAILPFEAGHSTSDLISRILSSAVHHER